MKKIATYIAVFLAIGTAAYAQPTITGAGCSPVAGETFYGHFFDTTGQSAGPSGAGVTWDYSAVSVYLLDTTSFVSCSSTPYCDSFPGSTLSSPDGFGGYEYYITDATRFADYGYADAGADNDHYSKPQVILPYPFSYGNMRADSFAATFGTSDFTNGVDSFIADGYGTLKLPTATYSNVLRIHRIEYARDSSVGSPAYYNRTEGYIWLAPNVHFPLAMAFYDTAGSVGGARYLSFIAFYTKDVSSVAGLSLENGQLQVYPNPASGTAYARCSATQPGDATMVVTDLTGRAMLAPTAVHLNAGANEIKLDVSAMPRGVYMIQLNAGDNRQVAKLVVQ